jgi:hypothetical protein
MQYFPSIAVRERMWQLAFNFLFTFQVFDNCPTGRNHYLTFNKAFERCYNLTGKTPGLASCVATEMGFVSFVASLIYQAW